MLRLVGTDEGSASDGEQEEAAGDERGARSDAQLKRLAKNLSVQLPTCPREARAVLEHLILLAAWEDEEVAVANDEQPAAPLQMFLTETAREERLAGIGFRNASSTYAASVLRRGFLGPKSFKA